MRLLDRYLLRELLVPLGYCLSGFLLLWIAGDLTANFGALQERKLEARDIAAYYLVRTPELIVLVLPIALLLAMLYTLTALARHHEITAIRAAGVSLWRLSLPYFLVGLLASLAVLALNEIWVPDSAEAAEHIRTRGMVQGNAPEPGKVQELNFTNGREDRLWRVGVYEVQTGRMLKPAVISTLADGSHLCLYAEAGLRTNGIWTFYDVRLYKEAPHEEAPPILLLKTNVLAMPSFSETPEQIRSEIRISRGTSLSSRNADIPIRAILHYLRLHPDPQRGAALYTKLHGRLATPWTCLVVVCMALPFGAASGRRNVFVGVASSILIFFAYYVLQQFSLAAGAGGYLPPWLAGWLPNLVFGTTGLWMTARAR